MKSSRLSKFRREPERLHSMTLTQRDRDALETLGVLGIATREQLQALHFPSKETACRRLQKLYHWGLVERLAYARAFFDFDGDEPSAQTDEAFGSAPIVYCLTKLGREVVEEYTGSDVKPPPQIKNPVFLAHALMVNDIYIAFLQASQRYTGHELKVWQDAEEAEQQFTVRYPDGDEETVLFRPDALLIYGVSQGTLAVFIEADRGTERGPERFAEKVRRYALLHTSGMFLTRYHMANFRVLTIVRTERRLWTLKEVIETESPPEHHKRFWLGLREHLDGDGLKQPRWWRAGEQAPKTFIPLG